MAGNRRKKTVLKSNTRNEIIGISILTAALLIALSLYFNSLGKAGEIIRDILLGTFGIAAYIMPAIIFLVGSVMIINRGRINIRRRFWAACVVLFVIVLIIHVNYCYNDRTLTLMDRLDSAYIFGIGSKGGGIFSQLIDIPLIYIFDKLGTYILLACIALIFTLLATEISIGDAINSLINKIKLNKKEKVNTVLQESAAGIETKNQENYEERKQIIEENIENIDKKIKILDFFKNEIDDENDHVKNKNIIQGDVKPETKLETKTDPKQETNIKTQKNDRKIDLSTEIQNNEMKKIEYIFPPLNLLSDNKNKGSGQDKKELLVNAKLIEDTLQSFGVDAKVVQVSRGPAVTRYELHPNAGVKVSRIVNLSDDISLSLAAPSVRIEAPIPGKAAVGIEVPNKEVVSVMLREVLESLEFSEFKSKLSFGLGKDIGGKCIVTDIAKMPHLLIAGATGSGKSVCINTLITSIIYKSSPEDVKMLMIDPKVVELSVYNGIPHLLIPVVTDPKKASSALFWAVNEMTQRYKTFADNNVRNIESYNKLMESKSPELKMPQIVIIIDELADLMMAAPNEVEDTICRLAQMARAAGMHLVIATQRPSVDVITGVIKANIPSRISFAVSSQIDSRTILDMAGAEKLLGKGDMLFLPLGENKPVRIQGAFISEKEVEKVVEFLKNSLKCDYDNNIIEEIEYKNQSQNNISEEVDELLPEAIRIGVEYGQISASMLQRRLRVGFNRAARIVEEMESRGIVGPQDGSKPRQVLMSKEEFEDNM